MMIYAPHAGFGAWAFRARAQEPKQASHAIYSFADWRGVRDKMHSYLLRTT